MRGAQRPFGVRLCGAGGAGPAGAAGRGHGTNVRWERVESGTASDGRLYGGGKELKRPLQTLRRNECRGAGKQEQLGV